MNIVRLEVGQMQANCYLVSNNSEAVIIDPGDDADYIIQKIQDEELVPVAILATHGHFDHIMGALTLQLAFSIPFYINSNDMFLVQKMRYSARHFLKTDPGPPAETVFLGEKFATANLEFSVIPFPGHTPGSVCFYNAKEKAVFVGDLIFADEYVGRTDFSYSDKNKMRESIDKIMKLPKDTIVYPGHGEEFTLSSRA